MTNEDVLTLRRDWLTDNVGCITSLDVNDSANQCLGHFILGGVRTLASPTYTTNSSRYLEREYLVHYKTSEIVLLRPSMSFLLSQTPDPRTLKGALPDFSQTSHIFLPVNDCRDVSEAEGGTHWSLLLVSVVDGIAFHYDSLPPGNQAEACVLRDKLAILLDKPLRFMQLPDSPEQENGSDCGVFVCMFMKFLLLKRLLLANQNQQISMSLGGQKMDADDGRREILRAIEKFRRRSMSCKTPYVLVFYLPIFGSNLAISGEEILMHFG